MSLKPRASMRRERTGDTWVIVLAAGEGRRLQNLTATGRGTAIPKQFCSLRGGPSLLHDTWRRAKSIAQPQRICTVVDARHQRWWGPALKSMDNTHNVIVQPSNRGTANGILLPLLHIMRRDPQARMVLLPSDHYVHNEAALADTLRSTLAIRETYPHQTTALLGVTPDRADPDLGYIVPGTPDATGTWTVDRFVEKPSLTLAQSLISAGALWNAFILVTDARALLQLYLFRFPQIVEAMAAAVEQDAQRPDQPVATSRLYRNLAHIDFSHHVLEGAEAMLRVRPVQSCGWSDLGTPKRVAETLDRFPPRARSRNFVEPTGALSLADRCLDRRTPHRSPSVTRWCASTSGAVISGAPVLDAVAATQE